MLGVGQDAHFVSHRADLGIRAAHRDVHLVLILSGLADVGHALGVIEFLVGDFDPVARDLHVLDLERLLLVGIERDALRADFTLQLVEAHETCGICLDVRLHHRMDRELRGRRGGVVRFQRDRLGDRPVEAGRVDVRGDLPRFARLDHFVEISDSAAAARLGRDDLQIGRAGVLDEERPVELVALGDLTVFLDGLHDGEPRCLF